jgi:hypothetical protein
VAEFKANFDRDFAFSAQGNQATATAQINSSGQLISVTPVDLGRGYTSAPTVKIVDADDGPGQGASVTANLSGDQVTSYTVNAPGSGYVNPLAFLSGGGVDDTNLSWIRDRDINKALTAAGINFNCALWDSQDEFSYVFLLKSAHFLCLNLKAASQAIRGRGGEWLRTAFNVGDVSAQYQIPDWMLRSKILGPLAETTYGCQYLQLLAPKTIGNARAVIGHTKP